jgi:hypothetical protein
MANWYGSARSNYVRVKDDEAFSAWVATLPGVELVKKEGKFALLVGRDSDTGGWPSFRFGANNEDEEIDLAAEIATHLGPGEIFVYCECGAEKLRYLTGWATAVKNTGESLHVSIDDIYSLVEVRWNCAPTTATY